jgi:tetratricopeptide (TPR) repeat protein
LPAVDKALRKMAEDLGAPQLAGMMEVPGIRLEAVATFAEAAKEFFEAAPWRHLTDQDLIETEPSGPPGLRSAVVLGNAGVLRGLGFVDDREQFWRIQGTESGGPHFSPGSSGLWQLTFGGISTLPLDDGELWREECLPVADDVAYPCAMEHRPSGRVRRPSLKVLDYLVGLLRGLAATTPEEIDRADWTKEVETLSGTRTFRMRLPFLIEPPSVQERHRHGIMPDRREMERTLAALGRYMDEHPAGSEEELNAIIGEKFTGKSLDEIELTPRNAAEQAQNLCYEAFAAWGRRRIQLAREALEVDANCVEALNLLAELEGDFKEKLRLYERGVEVGEKNLGEDMFVEERGHFWGILSTRPYMRAREGLAETLALVGLDEEAVPHYQALLDLNPNDNQGARHPLLHLLLGLGRDEEAEALLDGFPDEPSLIWTYARPLVMYRQRGKLRRAGRALRDAIEIEPGVVEYLLDPDLLAADISDPDGPRDEAVACADHLLEYWHQTPGAVDWLEEQTRRR